MFSAYNLNTMSKVPVSFFHLFESYKRWVSSNPQMVGDVESTIKWVSYFVAGRLNNSSTLSELIYSMSNLLMLLNDQIINQSRQAREVGPSNSLKTLLTVLEYVEVFIELYARRKFGSKGRWTVAAAVQIIKCALKLRLLVHYKEGVILSPPIPPLNRSNFSSENDEKVRIDSEGFILPNSGRVMRKMNSAPPLFLRTWKPPATHNNNKKCEAQDRSLEAQLIAESIYILKPMLHLYSMWVSGEKSWKPWLLALCVDLASLQLYKRKRITLTKEEKKELSRRSVALILYVLRSPFYERHSRDRVLNFIHAFAQSVPFAHILCKPLAQYLPSWQDTYFYLWSS